MQVISHVGRLGRTALAAAAGCAAVLALATAAQAGVSSRAADGDLAAGSTGPAAPFGGTSHLSSISCRRASWCLAVGGYTTTDHVRHSLAAIWTGTGWRTLKNPPGHALSEVACSSTTFCMAAGGPTGALTWHGSSWRKIPAPSGGLPSLTCASRTLCMRIHGLLVSVWRGTSWRDAKATDVCSGSAPGLCGLASVSCGGPANCVAVGTVTISQEPVQNAAGAEWNGKNWSVDTELPSSGDPAAMNKVACARSFCMAGGGSFQESSYGGAANADGWDAVARTWTATPIDLGILCHGFQTCGWPAAVGCARASSCMTLGAPAGQFWNGNGWKAAPTVSAGRGSLLRSISCGGSDCLAIGHRTSGGRQRTLAELWNGSSWSIIGSPK